MFSPEFLREGQALYDNLYPSRIIVGEKVRKEPKNLANLPKKGALKKDITIKYMDSLQKSEAVKYLQIHDLTLRVSYFMN